MGISEKVADHLRDLLHTESSERPAQATLVDDAAGGSLGPYQLEGVIGAGGMGTVYRARDRVTGEPVAVKVPHAGPFPFSSRFERESWYAHALAQVGDAPYLDHGVTSSGTPFLAMPLLSGSTLAERLHAAGSLEPREVLRMGERVAGVLASLHGRGLLHRDVKPQNILIDEGQRVWLVDHGLTGSPDTLRGAGTATHAAPEQLEGRRVGPSADVYALGLCMLEAWLGEPVFRDAAARADASRLVEGKLARVHVSPVRALIARLLEHDPERRPADGAHAARAIARLRARACLSASALEWRTRGILGDVPFVGRERDMDALCRSIATHGAAEVSGPPGIGKSRLIVAWWRAHAPSDATLAWPVAAVSPHPRAPGQLAWQWLEALAGARGAESVAERRSAVRELAAEVVDDETATTLCNARVSEQTLVAVFDALIERGPLVLVIDHAQPPDRASMLLLEQLSRRHPGGVIALYERAASRGTLAALAGAAMQAIAASVPATAHRDRALHRAQGNPLAFQAFVIEPADTIDDALSRRIARLDPYARWLLRLASLRGLTFRARDILAVAGRCDGPIVRDGLNRLASARLLVDLTRDDGAPAGTYCFSHGAIAAAARRAWAAGELALGARLLGER